MPTASEQGAIDAVRLHRDYRIRYEADKLVDALDAMFVDQGAVNIRSPCARRVIFDAMSEIAPPALDVSRGIDIVADTCAAAGMPLTEAQRLLVAGSVAVIMSTRSR